MRSTGGIHAASGVSGRNTDRRESVAGTGGRESNKLGHTPGRPLLRNDIQGRR